MLLLRDLNTPPRGVAERGGWCRCAVVLDSTRVVRSEGRIALALGRRPADVDSLTTGFATYQEKSKVQTRTPAPVVISCSPSGVTARPSRLVSVGFFVDNPTSSSCPEEASQTRNRPFSQSMVKICLPFGAISSKSKLGDYCTSPYVLMATAAAPRPDDLRARAVEVPRRHQALHGTRDALRQVHRKDRHAALRDRVCAATRRIVSGAN